MSQSYRSWGELVVPQQLAPRAELGHRVGIQVGAGSAGPPRIAARTVYRRGVAHADVDVALAVERGGYAPAAAGVDVRVPPQVLHLVPAPLRRAGSGVQRPQRSLGVGEILTHRGVGLHGGHVHRAVVVARGHADALVVVAGQRPDPQLPAGGRRQGERGVIRRPVHHCVGHVDAVRAAVGRVVGVPPQDLAGGEADRHHVRLQVLDVNHAVHHHRRGRVSAVGVRCGYPRSGTVHATPSFDTFELLIGLATSRVFCWLPPGSVQPAATAGSALPVGAGPPDPPAAPVPLPAGEPGGQASALAGWWLLAQPPAARLAAATRHTPAAPRASGAGSHRRIYPSDAPSAGFCVAAPNSSA